MANRDEIADGILLAQQRDRSRQSTRAVIGAVAVLATGIILAVAIHLITR